MHLKQQRTGSAIGGSAVQTQLNKQILLSLKSMYSSDLSAIF